MPTNSARILEGGDLHPDIIQVHDVEVKRLRDDRSEIRPGDDVAFVATAKFRLCPATDDASNDAKGRLRKLEVDFPDVSSHRELFAINEDAELVSSLAMDEESVEAFLKECYHFDFFVNGKSQPTTFPAGQGPDDEHAAPWITLFNTGSVAGEYFDFEVDISTSCPKPPPASTTDEDLILSLPFKRNNGLSGVLEARVSAQLLETFTREHEVAIGQIPFHVTFVPEPGVAQIAAPPAAQPAPVDRRPTQRHSRRHAR